MKNYLGEGGKFEFTGVARTAGQLVLKGSRVGMVVETVGSSETGIAITKDRWSYAKLSTDVVTVGARLYYDDTNDRLTLTAGTLKFAGWATKDAGNGVTTVEFELAGGDYDS